MGLLDSESESVDATQSVTGWFHALKSGDEAAAVGLWGRYFDRVVRLAKNRLTPDAGYDEEDLAVSVFGALYKAAEDGRYATLSDRNELWALLLVLSQRKMIDRTRRLTAQRRTGSQTGTAAAIPLETVASTEQTPDLSAAVKDECRHLLEVLGDQTLQDIALLKLDGHTIPEIAKQLSLGERTVSRKLLLIRKSWEEKLAEQHED
ncbi:MAG: ECF-type sigma factor [Fuerstiella sp.]